jgi:hypothetical protein
MAAMFTMMNNARLSVGVQGVGVAEAAMQHALAYAADRHQGPTPLSDTGAIIDHADVRRMLATMKAEVFSARAIALSCAVAIDMARATDAPDWQARAALLTPIAKAFGTDTGVVMASMGIQVHGGMGFIEDTGAAQYLRDVRVTTIYEGTNGIQAMDLVGRKMMDAGEAAKGARDEAKWMRLAEAGLGIASGDSPYAFSNLKGAMPALRGYGEDIRELRKEDRARVKDLFEIQKERADVANKEKMLEVQRLAATKPSSVEFLAQLYKTDPELARKIQGERKAGVMTFEEAYKIIAADLKNASLSDAEKAQKARNLMSISEGGGASVPNVLTYVPGQGIK